MLFNSFDFLIFFPIVVLAYYLIPHKVRYIWLLLCSYFFYMCWNAKYALLLFASTLVTYVSGLLIERFAAKRKLFVVLCFILNLSVLFFFKYFGFAAQNLNSILSALHLGIVAKPFDIILPVGISFYIFQALSYTMDVYRGEVKSEHNFLKYALFVSFFPQLVAGPIERSKNLLSQIDERHTFNYEKVRDGLLLMLWGYFQKLVIADRIAIFVDTVYGDYTLFNGYFLIVATLLFAFQIYCDFSGYTLIAIGAAKVMGFRLMENFNCPYYAKSVAEFWTRWHISLTSWFRDYLYIPLGGNRKGTFRKYINVMVVFLVSGMWHGAQWSFIVWGGLNGLFQVIGNIFKPVRKKLCALFNIDCSLFSHRFLQTIITFVLVDFTWIFFRAPGCKDALLIIKNIFTVHNPWILFDGTLYKAGLDQKNFSIMLFSILLLLAADLFKYKGIKIREVLVKQELWFRWLVYTLSLMFILIFGVWGADYNAASFIYFQF